MPLTSVEKAAGRVFRDEVQAKLVESFETNPPTYQVPNFLAIYRHLCPKRQDRSTALELKEKYELSPAHRVMRVGEKYVVMTEDMTGDPRVRGAGEVEILDVPAGRFGFIYKEGKCRGCGHTARSKAGKLVDAYERPPSSGRVAR